MTIFLISAFTGNVDDFVAKKASSDVMNIPSSTSTINDCANGSPLFPPPPPPSLSLPPLSGGCLTAIVLLALLVIV